MRYLVQKEEPNTEPKYSNRRSWGHAIRVGRGSIGPAILCVLIKKPMHGYEIISTLETKSHNMWRPSPGSIYPTLQLLEARGMVESNMVSGRRIYNITEEGRVLAMREHKKCDGIWRRGSRASGDYLVYRRTSRELINSIWNILRKGNDEQIRQLTKATTQFIAKLNDIEKGQQ